MKQCPAKVIETLSDDGTSTFERNGLIHTHEKLADLRLKAVVSKECCEKAAERVFQPVGQIIDEVKLKYLGPDRMYAGLGKVKLYI